MKAILMLNVSEFNNEWNQKALARVWRERERRFRGPEDSEESSKPPSDNCQDNKSNLPPIEERTASQGSKGR
jgi:hypothetical protein